MSATVVDTATPAPAFDRFAIWGTSAVLGVSDPGLLATARSLLDDELALVEQAASRFREGTEILDLNRCAGSGPVVVTAVLLDLVRCALAADVATGGACDPTIADALVALGYDRDFDELLEAPVDQDPMPAPGTSGILVDPSSSTVTLPMGVHLDLGATAKARAADRAALRIAEELGIGVLVDLGGDLRVAGAPPVDGWQVGITREARSGSMEEVDEVISVTAGGIASSSTTVRTWRRGDSTAHHVIDPRTGSSTGRTWSMVTVAASTCTIANSLSTAALVWGEEALFELPQRSIAARLVRGDGTVERVGGWPEPIDKEGTR